MRINLVPAIRTALAVAACVVLAVCLLTNLMMNARR